MVDFFLSLAASIAFAFLAISFGWSLRRLNDWRDFAHVTRFIGGGSHVKIVVPGSVISSFTIRLDDRMVEARVPRNVLSMGMSEGQAVAEMMAAIHRVSPKTKLDVVPAPHFHDDGTPFVSIGGLSINIVSRRYVARFFPYFSIQYPEHVASWAGTMIYKPRFNGDELLDEYGFAFIGATDRTRFLIFFGVWTFGTLIAVRSYLALKRQATVYGQLFGKQRTLLVAHGSVSTYSVDVK
jgi:hypothetical protein